MLMLVIFVISVMSSSARTIENDTSESLDLFETTNETNSELHREKRQLFGFTDFGTFFGRAADNFNRIRSVVENGLALSTSITNMINATANTNQPRTVQAALQTVMNGARDVILGYFRRMGILQ
ncbi:hypothetical protein HNY73_001225 [Argiope bruennichi]|uniref:Uncharacterized protein n=2 Tax=Argiope bruennichi TaxID=94029 RepID=A0A8T0G1X9_ARGBR|nr:hypothetical protein HNY73_001225 [Argiope bruennichi]